MQTIAEHTSFLFNEAKICEIKNEHNEPKFAKHKNILLGKLTVLQYIQYICDMLQQKVPYGPYYKFLV